MIAVKQMLVLSILMLVGFIAYKKDIINREAHKKLSGIVVNIAAPASILVSVLSDRQFADGRALLQVILIALVMHGAYLLLAQWIPGLLRVNKKDEKVYGVMTVFSNLSFIGFPVVSSLCGEQAVFYAAIFTLPYNILIYTYGVRSLSSGSDGESAPQITVRQILTRVCNVGILSCFVAILLFITKIEVPDFLKSSLTMLGNLTAPLSMICIGVSFALLNLRDVFLDCRLYVFSFLKLLAIPVLAMLLLDCFSVDSTVRTVCMIMFSVPVGSMTAMFAQEYGGNYELAAKGVALTTLLSVITMPIVFALFF